jgi:hypothetical protein
MVDEKGGTELTASLVMKGKAGLTRPPPKQAWANLRALTQAKVNISAQSHCFIA